VSAPRRLGQKAASPVVGYFDRMFAGVQHRLDELFLELSRSRDDIDDTRRAIGLEVDVLHEVILGLERQIVELTDRIEHLETTDAAADR
jgi:uncharacterized protein YaaN involved in tellurite resistance